MLSILGDEQLASFPEFMDDSLINELLNGPMDSQSGWKPGKWFFFFGSVAQLVFKNLFFYFNLLLVEETNLAKMEQSHSGIPENAVFLRSGGEVNKQLPFIPEESDFMFAVEAEMVGDPLEEA